MKRKSFRIQKVEGQFDEFARLQKTAKDLRDQKQRHRCESCVEGAEVESVIVNGKDFDLCGRCIKQLTV